ncbi:MAG: TonB-dependent receptor [Gammaproteobacteria bacterium]|nr:TonB-dependent receptor [Gammaproteobacteria bacterium]MDE2264047.1 TonB-dependent receptor [Gammaproteobacteria bacterium]
MKLTSRLVSGAVALAMAGAVPAWADAAAQATSSPAADQSSSGQQPQELQEIVVTGIRQSMESALHIKQFADTIEDSIVATDIGKLPDVTAIDAIQRIPGIQISRQLGEGGGTVSIGGSSVMSGYEIRGLPQAETTLNGREVFSAQGSRVLNLADIPSALLAGIDVYKDPTADQIEGGIAGTVDLRTHKPFDFSGLELEGSAEEQYGDLIGQAKPAFTGLASDTWDTGIGKMGALLTLSYQDRSYREDSATNNAVATSSTAVPGETIVYPNGAYNTMFVGDRRRTGVDAVLQWQPADDLQTYAEASSEDFVWAQNQYTFTTSGNAKAIDAVSLFPGTTDVQSITWGNAAVGTVGAWRTVEDVNRQFALHAKWTPAPWTVEGDISYTKATERLNNPAVKIGAVAPLLSQLNSTAGVPESIVSNADGSSFDMSNLANYGGTTSNFQSYTYDTEQHFRGGETAGRLDVTYALPSGFVNSLQAGVRLADRKDAFNQWSNFGAVTTAGVQGNPQWFGEVPLSPFFSATESSAVQPQYAVFNPNVLHFNLAGVDQAFGIAPPLDNGSQDYHVDERDYAGYFRVNFGTDWAIPMTGNIGLRVARHTDHMTGELASGGVYTPSLFDSGQTVPLPSLNLTFKLRPDLQLRLGASKAISYPDFTQIRPSISLLPAQGAASGGNPNLKPTKATQFDASLEWYFAQGSALTADVFYKKLTDFILQETQQNAFTVNGVTYNLTGAIDGGDGSIKGFELGYQQFFRNLPGLLSGLGAEVNYTYIKAAAPTAVVGQSTTLPGLSKNSYNLIGIYERGPVSFRLAYNWRSQFYNTIYNGSNAQLATNPIYTKDYGWLDASLEYNVSSWLSLYAQGSNLLRSRITQFYGVQTLLQSQTIDDRQATLGFRVKF